MVFINAQGDCGTRRLSGRWPKWGGEGACVDQRNASLGGFLPFGQVYSSGWGILHKSVCRSRKYNDQSVVGRILPVIGSQGRVGQVLGCDEIGSRG
jgi:hypothetical protein